MFQMSCDSLYSEVVSMHKTLEQTDRVWAQFKHLSGQVKDHLRHCHSQIEAVNVPGVSLDARRERYEVGVFIQYRVGVSIQYRVGVSIQYRMGVSI